MAAGGGSVEAITKRWGKIAKRARTPSLQNLYLSSPFSGSSPMDKAKKTISRELFEKLTTPDQNVEFKKLMAAYYDAMREIAGRQNVGALAQADLQITIDFFKIKKDTEPKKFKEAREKTISYDTSNSSEGWLRQNDSLSKRLFSDGFFNALNKEGIIKEIICAFEIAFREDPVKRRCEDVILIAEKKRIQRRTQLELGLPNIEDVPLPDLSEEESKKLLYDGLIESINTIFFPSATDIDSFLGNKTPNKSITAKPILDKDTDAPILAEAIFCLIRGENYTTSNSPAVIQSKTTLSNLTSMVNPHIDDIIFKKQKGLMVITTQPENDYTDSTSTWLLADSNDIGKDLSPHNTLSNTGSSSGAPRPKNDVPNDNSTSTEKDLTSFSLDSEDDDLKERESTGSQDDELDEKTSDEVLTDRSDSKNENSEPDEDKDGDLTDVDLNESIEDIPLIEKSSTFSSHTSKFLSTLTQSPSKIVSTLKEKLSITPDDKEGKKEGAHKSEKQREKHEPKDLDRDNESSLLGKAKKLTEKVTESIHSIITSPKETAKLSAKSDNLYAKLRESLLLDIPNKPEQIKPQHELSQFFTPKKATNTFPSQYRDNDGFTVIVKEEKKEKNITFTRVIEDQAPVSTKFQSIHEGNGVEVTISGEPEATKAEMARIAEKIKAVSQNSSVVFSVDGDNLVEYCMKILNSDIIPVFENHENEDVRSGNTTAVWKTYVDLCTLDNTNRIGEQYLSLILESEDASLKEELRAGILTSLHEKDECNCTIKYNGNTYTRKGLVLKINASLAEAATPHSATYSHSYFKAPLSLPPISSPNELLQSQIFDLNQEEDSHMGFNR